MAEYVIFFPTDDPAVKKCIESLLEKSESGQVWLWVAKKRLREALGLEQIKELICYEDEAKKWGNILNIFKFDGGKISILENPLV